MYQRKLIGTVITVALASMIAACSSSGSAGQSASDGGTSNTAPSATGAQPSGTPILIGTIGSYTGSFPRLVSGAKYGVQAWADSVNASGGIDGRPIQLYAMDDQGSAATALSDAKTLITNDHVVAIVGEQSQNGAPWIPWVASQGIPIIGGNTYDTPTMTNPDFYDVGGNLLSTFYGIAALARKNGLKAAALYCAESPACAATPALLNGLGKSLGVSVAYSAPVSQTAPDYTAQCQGLASSGAKSYTLAMAPQVFEKVVDQCVQQGYTGHVILPDTADDTLASAPGFSGTQIVSSLVPAFIDSTPATQEFHAALKKYAPQVGGPLVGLDETVVSGWASGKLFQAAVQASGSTDITPASLKKGLYALKGETLGGLTMPLTFTPGKPAPGNCYFTYQIQNGNYAAPNGINPVCVNPAILDKALAGLGA